MDIRDWTVSNFVQHWRNYTKYDVDFDHDSQQVRPYQKELSQLAVSTFSDELLFYTCSEYAGLLEVSHALLVKETVNTINYWSNGSKAVFSFGDTCGNLSVFISYSLKENGLFYKDAYEKISLKDYPTVYHSALLTNPSQNFLCIKINIFQEVCSKILFIPSLESFAICSSSTKTMVYTAMSNNVSTTVYKSSKKCFNCVEYFPSHKSLVTGGEDGLLRIWSLDTSKCQKELKGHVTSVTHIKINPNTRRFISLSTDKNLRIWSQNAWLCLQTLQVEDMGRDPIATVCYNIINNELVLANVDIAKIMGRGTDVFQNVFTSHKMPLVNILYNTEFKQVVTACQSGVVIVWDIFTGKPLLEFRVTPNKNVGLTAMSFDELQRRLITVSQDGKLKLWNFNSGSEIAVLPVTVPKQGASTVCLNNRVFVSGKDTNLIYDLDMEGCDIRFLKHSYLNDISSMDGYKNTLVTTSSNGNIVIWDVNTAKALYLLNENNENDENPSDTMRMSLGKNSTGVTGTLFLNDGEGKGAVLTSADDYIYIWSVTSNAGPVGKFRAVEDEGAVITTMSTDVNKEILVTGDSTGKIYLWDIKEFGFTGEDDKEPPTMLNSWEAHRSSQVVSVKCYPAYGIIFTAGMDCNAKVWTDQGWYIGRLGRDTWEADRLQPSENDGLEPAKSPLPTESKKSQTSVTETLNCDDLLHRVDLALMTLSRDELRSQCKRELGFTLPSYVKEKTKKSPKRIEKESKQGEAPDISKLGFLYQTMKIKQPLPVETIPYRKRKKDEAL